MRICFIISMALLLMNDAFAQETYKDNVYETGQIWSYQTRNTEDSSRITIVAIENSKKMGIIISVFIYGIKIKNPGVEGGMNKELEHLAFTKEAIDKSVIEMKDKTDNLPPYEKEYERWKNDFDAGNAPVFSVPVKEAIQQIEDLVSQPKKGKTR